MPPLYLAWWKRHYPIGHDHADAAAFFLYKCGERKKDENKYSDFSGEFDCCWSERGRLVCVWVFIHLSEYWGCFLSLSLYPPTGTYSVTRPACQHIFWNTRFLFLLHSLYAMKKKTTLTDWLSSPLSHAHFFRVQNWYWSSTIQDQISLSDENNARLHDNMDTNRFCSMMCLRTSCFRVDRKKETAGLLFSSFNVSWLTHLHSMLLASTHTLKFNYL